MSPHCNIDTKRSKKKDWCELNEYTACYFKDILRTTPYKTVFVWALTSYLIKYSSKTKKTYKALLKKQVQTQEQTFS